MKSKKINLLAYILLTIFFISVLSNVSVATWTSVNYGKLYVTGTVTKDITDISSVMTGIDESSTFTLDMRQEQKDDLDRYGNITANPSEIIHSAYNKSGYLDHLDWIETDLGSVSTLSISEFETGLKTMQLAFNSDDTSRYAYYTNTLDYSMSVANKYLSIGIRVNTNNYNGSGTARFRAGIVDINSELLTILDKQSATNYESGTVVGHECIYFDADSYQDVIMFQMKISDFDALQSTFDFNNVAELVVGVGYADDDGCGIVNLDIFCFEILDTPIKFGKDAGDLITSESDYVVMNVTSPTSPDLTVVELDSAISYIVDADIDVIRTINPKNPIYDFDSEQSLYWYYEEYEASLEIDADLITDIVVSATSINIYYVMQNDESKYSAFTLNNVDKSSLILNKKKGDIVTVDSSCTVNVPYLIKLKLFLTQAEYDLAVTGADGLNVWNYLSIAGIVVVFGFLGFFSKKMRLKKENKIRLIRTKGANK